MRVMGRRARCFDVLDDLAGVVDLVAEVEVDAERDARLAVAEVDGAEAGKRALVAAGDADVAGAVEEEELDVGTAENGPRSFAGVYPFTPRTVSPSTWRSCGEP